MDLTSFGTPNPNQPSGNLPQPQPVRQTPIEPETNSVPQNAAAEAHRRSHWTIDKSEQDGQIEALPEDDEHREIVRKTLVE